jgi:hypothetical protein
MLYCNIVRKNKGQRHEIFVFYLQFITSIWYKMNIEKYKFGLRKEVHVIYLCYFSLEKKLFWQM